MNCNISEVARLRQRLDEEYQAALWAMRGYANVGKHEFITRRLENMGEIHDRLKRIVGEEPAVNMLMEAMEKVEERQ